MRLYVIEIAVECGARLTVLPRESDPAVRLEAAQLRLVDLARDRVHLVGEEAAVHPVEAFGHGQRHIPAHPEIESEFRGDFDIVLHPGGEIDPLVERIRREAG
jgi:hypothetical protein